MSTIVTEGYLPKLWVIVHTDAALSKHLVNVPSSARISSKSKTVQTLLGTDGQETLADKLTLANGSTNIPLSSVATTTLSDLESNQSHNCFCNTADAKSVKQHAEIPNLTSLNFAYA